MTSRRAKGDSKNGISSKKIIFIKGINTVKNQKLDFEKIHKITYLTAKKEI